MDYGRLTISQRIPKSCEGRGERNHTIKRRLTALEAKPESLSHPQPLSPQGVSGYCLSHRRQLHADLGQRSRKGYSDTQCNRLNDPTDGSWEAQLAWGLLKYMNGRPTVTSWWLVEAVTVRGGARRGVAGCGRGGGLVGDYYSVTLAPAVLYLAI